MPAKIFYLSKKANKNISCLPLKVQNKIDKAFTIIKSNPISGVKLQGELNDYYKFRVGDYRIIYTFNLKESLVEITRVEHRQGVYR